jgi:hypothetical protein
MTIDRGARQIAGYPGYAETVALFSAALEEPIAEAADFIRRRLSAALALRVELPAEG